jgi:hypothetical protein
VADAVSALKSVDKAADAAAAAKTGDKASDAAAAAKTGSAGKTPVASKSSSGCANSFSPDTLVVVGDGSVTPIGDVVVGDEVLSLDPATGARSVESVTAVIDGNDSVVSTVSLSDGSQVVTTPGHRWWVVDGREFVRADHLSVGDRVLTVSSDTLTVTGVETVVGASRPMVNLTVDSTHTFYAGTTPVLVHNTDPGCPVGGTYTLTDPNSGEVVRTGRSNNLDRREGEHRRAPETKGLDFTPVHRTDDYAEQRGLEQVVYRDNPGAQADNGGLNRIRPIGDRNPNKKAYEDAATQFLAKSGR